MIPNQPSDEFSILSARTVLSRTQWKILLILGLVFIVALAFNMYMTLMIVNVVSILFYIVFCQYKLMLQLLSLHLPPRFFDPSSIPAGGWPKYTILVPLYHEEKAGPSLMAHLRKMEYPLDRMQILLLVEEDDQATRLAIESAGVSHPFEVVIWLKS